MKYIVIGLASILIGACTIEGHVETPGIYECRALATDQVVFAMDSRDPVFEVRIGYGTESTVTFRDLITGRVMSLPASAASGVACIYMGDTWVNPNLLSE